MTYNFQGKTLFSRFFQSVVNKYLLSHAEGSCKTSSYVILSEFQCLSLAIFADFEPRLAATFGSLLACISPGKGEIYNLGYLSRVKLINNI